MDEVLRGVGGVSDLIGQIALASGEQSKGIAQVTLAVAELDRVTQQNATLVQAVSATAGSLSGQTTALSGAITRFTLPAANGNVTASVLAGPRRQASPPVTPSPEGDWVAFGHR
jgi:methyl-accepting chemotaxis protein